MHNKTLIKSLNKLGKRIEKSIDNTNYGGCCVVAVEIAKYLKQHVPVKIRVSYQHIDEEDMDEPLDAVHERVNGSNNAWDWNDWGVSFGHVFVEFEHEGKRYFVDSSGVKKASAKDPTFKWPVYKGHVPLSTAKKLVANRENWNSSFNRRQIPSIRKMVREIFEQLGEQTA